MLGKLQFAAEEYEAAIGTFERIKELDPADEQAYYHLGQATARSGDAELGRTYLQQHRRLLDAKVELYGLEQQAAREPFNSDVRRELARSYSEIGLDDLAKFWNRSAQAVAARQ